MKDQEKTRAQLQEVNQLREHIRALEESESERRFRGAFKYAAFGMALLDEQGRFIEVNCSLCEMLGYSQEELLTKTFKDVTYPEDLPVGSELFQDLRSGKRKFGWLEKRYMHRDGHIIWTFLSTSAIRDAQGHFIGVVSQIQDITERKQAEKKLKSYQEHLEDLVEVRTAELQKEIAERRQAEEQIKDLAKFPAENPNPVMRIAKDGTILYANSSSLCLLETWGCQINQSLPDKWVVFTKEVFRSRSGTLAEVECEDLVFSLAFAPVVDAGYVNVYGHDITERKQAEKGLQQAKDKLEIANQELEERVQKELQKHQAQQQLLIQRSKLESLGKLAAGIAHEINQPLAGISMGLDNVLLKLSSKKMTEEYLHQKIDVLLQHIDRIKHIIEHIRTFSREQVSTSIERVDVNEVCRNALSMLHTQYTNHNVTMTSDLDETVGYVIGNTYKLEQVVLNLITNAKDAVDKKEQMSKVGSYQKRITISTFCDADRAYVNIEDNGVGIAEEHIHNIFDPFFTTKDPEHGTGLGLSVSYGIIKEMNGDISVQSQLGEYTLMRISLPRW